mgnify:FL=1|jgi:molecular chaperone DnaJ
MSKRDYYEILGVLKNATKDEIKKAYKKAAIKFHPDKNPGDKSAEEKFKESAEAYSVLSDQDKKSRYDQFGHDGLRGSGGGGFSGFGGQGMSMDDIFSQFGDLFGGGGFGDIFGGRSTSRRSSGTGSDLKIRLPMTLEEIATGVTKTIKVKRQEICDTCGGVGAMHSSDIITCSTCHGAGEVQQVSRSMFGQFVNVQPCPHCNGRGKTVRNPCSTCHGEGVTKKDAAVEANIPAGVSNGNYLTMRGEGNKGKKGSAAGSLIIVVSEKEHELFMRSGNDVVIELDVPIYNAVLGDKIEVPTLYGKVKMKIPPGTSSGKILRLRGKGIPHLNSHMSGDQLVSIRVNIPNNPTHQEKVLYEELKSIGEKGHRGKTEYRKPQV